MSDETNQPSQTPEPERGGHAGASNGPTPQARTRTMMLIGIGIVCFFLLLLAIGVIPRLRNDQALTMAAQKACRSLGVGRFPMAWSYLGPHE